MMAPPPLAELLYEAYARATDSPVSWSHLPESSRAHWREVADAAEDASEVGALRLEILRLESDLADLTDELAELKRGAA